MKYQLYIAILLLIVSSSSTSFNNREWVPINKGFDNMNLNSSTIVGDDIIAVGEYGTILKTNLSQNANILNGSFEEDDLYDIDYDGSNTLLAVGDNGYILRSDTNLQTWKKIDFHYNDNLNSVVSFKSNFYLSSENNIYLFNTENENISLILTSSKKINKLHRASNEIYAIGEKGFLAVLSGDIFVEVHIETEENISEMISRAGKIILFPNKETPIYTDDNFENSKRLESENPQYFVYAAAWIDDSLIVSIGSNSEMGPFVHSFSEDLTSSWVMGFNPIVPNLSLKDHGDFAIITADRSVIVFVDKNIDNVQNFDMFRNFLSLGNNNEKFTRLTYKNEFYAFNNKVNIIVDAIENRLDVILHSFNNIFDIVRIQESYYFIIQNTTYESGRNLYEKYFVVSNGNESDTLAYFEFGKNPVSDIFQFNNKILFELGSTLYIYNVDSKNLEEINLEENILQIKIFNDKIYLLQNYITDTDEYRYTISEFDIETNKLELIVDDVSIRYFALNNSELFYLKTERNGNVYTEKLINYETKEVVFSIQKKYGFIKYLHSYRHFILMHDNNKVYYSLDGGTNWAIDSTEYIIEDIACYENKVLASAGNFLYYREFDIKSSVDNSPLTTNPISFSIFPNPATDEIEITGIENANMQEIEIFNMLGEKVITQSIHPMTLTHRMNVGQLPTGMYIVKIGDRVTSFIKQ